MTQLFGTDGIRGRANQYPITAEIALITGRAVARMVRSRGDSMVIVGQDTRQSGEMLAHALAGGICSEGINVRMAGIIPTPGIAYGTRMDPDAGAGVMISASHNPFYDNGIKIFNHQGYKLDDETEAWIEAFIQAPPEDRPGHVGRILIDTTVLSGYLSFLKLKFPKRKLDRPLKLVIDCANGAASQTAQQLFCQPSVLDTCFLFVVPDGKNINDNCGSQYLSSLRQKVLETGSDLGLAFDGDADRLIAMDETGREITGDIMLAIAARRELSKKQGPAPIVVSTIMSNIGLSIALANMGVVHETADVGDKKVLEMMIQTGARIGGEDSGHLLFLDDHTTGDGLLSAVKLISAVMETREPLSKLASVMDVFPQVLMNVPVDESRPDFMTNKTIAAAIRKVEDQLKDRGRVLIRYSGTQPLLRVMVEGPDAGTTEAFAHSLCRVIETNMAGTGRV